MIKCGIDLRFKDKTNGLVRIHLLHSDAFLDIARRGQISPPEFSERITGVRRNRFFRWFDNKMIMGFNSTFDILNNRDHFSITFNSGKQHNEYQKN